MLTQIDKAAFIKSTDDEVEYLEVPGAPAPAPVVTRLKSYWDYFDNRHDLLDALLICEGDITIANPDQNSAISALRVIINAQMHFQRGTQKLDSGDIRIVALSRHDADLQAGGRGTFKPLVEAQIPHASYRKSATEDFCPRESGFKPHIGVLREHGIESGRIGLAIVSVNNLNLDANQALQELRNAPALSSNPQIREAIYHYIRSALHAAAPKFGAANEAKSLPSATGQLPVIDVSPI